MSRFIDKLKATCGAEPQSMGFSIRQPAHEKPRMQLVASLASVDFDHLPDVSRADAGIVRISSPAEVKALEKLGKTMENIPWGAWLKGTGSESIAKAVKSGCDFVVFSPADTPLAVFKDNKPGRILEVDPSLSEGLLRTVNDLPVDAVLIVSEAEGFLTWRHLMLFQRLAGLMRKPVLVSVPSKVTADELQTLWGVGVSGVVIALEDEKAGDRLTALRKEVEKLPSPSNRERMKRIALLPRISAETAEPVEEEAEEE